MRSLPATLYWMGHVTLLASTSRSASPFTVTLRSRKAMLLIPERIKIPRKKIPAAISSAAIMFEEFSFIPVIFYGIENM